MLNVSPVPSQDGRPRKSPSSPSAFTASSTAPCLIDELAEVPRVYIKDVLVTLAPRILTGVNHTTLATRNRVLDSNPLPSTVSCTFNPQSSSRGVSPLLPDFLIALDFPQSSSTPTRLLVPAHSLVYSLVSPRLELLTATKNRSNPFPSQTSATQPFELSLPLLGPFHLPSYKSFAILHSYLHLRSPQRLVDSIIPSSLNPSSPIPSPPASPETRILPLLDTDPRPLLAALKEIDALQETIQALGIEDYRLDETLRNLWDDIVRRIENVKGCPPPSRFSSDNEA